MSRIYFHVGFHKTGTTKLQFMLSTNRKVLKQFGLIYPKTRRFRAHHDFALALGERTFGWQDQSNKVVDFKHAKRMTRLLRRSKKDIVVSSEFLSTLTEERILWLKNQLKDKDVTIIFTLRSISKILPSAYQQEVKNGSKRRYTDWLMKVFSTTPNKVNQRFWGRHNHHLEIEKWMNVFGKKNIQIIISNETNHDFMINEFMRIICEKQNLILKDTGNASINRSLTDVEVELLIQLNEEFDRTLSWREYVSILRGTFVKSWTDRPAELSGGNKIVNPLEFRDAIQTKADEIQKYLKKLPVSVIGDIESLRKVNVGNHVTPSQIEISHIIRPILSRSTKKIVKHTSVSKLVQLKLRASLGKVSRKRIRRIKKRVGMVFQGRRRA